MKKVKNARNNIPTVEKRQKGTPPKRWRELRITLLSRKKTCKTEAETTRQRPTKREEVKLIMIKIYVFSISNNTSLELCPCVHARVCIQQ